MRKVLKYVGYLLAIALVLIIALLTVASIKVESRRSAHIEIDVPNLTISSDPKFIDEGARLTTMKGCRDCHGEDLGGKAFIDDPPIGKIWGPNLTSGLGSVTKQYTDKDWLRSIRYAVRPSGHPLVAMPADDFNLVSLEDLSRIIAYVKQVPAVDRENPPISIGPVARVLYLFGNFPLLFPVDLIDVKAAPVQAMEPTATAAYGKYLSSSCLSCHGPGFSGGAIPGVPPAWPKAANLTPSGRIKEWTLAQFTTVLREGKTPEGRQIEPQFMPWTAFKAMSDVEIEALFAFLKELAPRTPETR